MSVSYKEKIKGEAKKYLEKNVTMIKNTHPRKAASILKSFGTAPGDSQTKDFTLIKHLEEGLSEQSQRSEILQYFAKVSQKYS